ncbi:MAG: hypothetical protein NTU51_02640 [Bacteroidetes bacterium]|nr:hypothetical protein [Bacteroidota bacterium]
MKRTGLLNQSALGFLICLLMAGPSCNTSTNQPRPLIPLNKGNFWSYSGNFNGKPVVFSMVVNDILKKGKLTFGLMKGFPSDVMAGADWEPSAWGLLVDENRHYYKIEGAKSDSIRKSFSDAESVQSGLVSDSDLFMEALCDTGQTFGEAAQLTRNDGNYFWKVTGKHAFEPTSIRGISISGPFDRYTLEYRTLADNVILEIVPGIGIVHYHYSHHGSQGELDLKLVEAGLK